MEAARIAAQTSMRPCPQGFHPRVSSQVAAPRACPTCATPRDNARPQSLHPCDGSRRVYRSYLPAFLRLRLAAALGPPAQLAPFLHAPGELPLAPFLDAGFD